MDLPYLSIKTINRKIITCKLKKHFCDIIEMLLGFSYIDTEFWDRFTCKQKCLYPPASPGNTRCYTVANKMHTLWIGRHKIAALTCTLNNRLYPSTADVGPAFFIQPLPVRLPVLKVAPVVAWLAGEPSLRRGFISKTYLHQPLAVLRHT